ncbi:MAG: hypothetical protein GAK45_01957 [Pseudomonas citronellolis]|nr:MAG: hypothetical protein GAK45_01957 [Pseudomonas citronellolis]
MPLVQIEGGQLTGGILFELFTATARQVGAQAVFHIISRARIEQAMLSESIDVRCYIAPNWLDHDVSRYRWSPMLMTQRDLLVSRQPTAVQLSDLPRQSIGTVLGYHYPGLQALIRNGQLQRDDARNQELVLKKLIIGRYDYAVSSEAALDWYRRLHPEAPRLYPASLIEETPLGCLVLQSPEIPTQAILDALANLKASGEVERILAHYRLTDSSIASTCNRAEPSRSQAR